MRSPFQPAEVEELRSQDEEQDDGFDRIAFATEALRLVRLRRTTVALSLGGRALHIESGRRWGHPGERWAHLAIPERASRRSIALAVSELAGSDLAPFTFDVLFRTLGDRARRG